MNLKRAQYIVAISECGSVTAAAQKLFISQPALSQTVRQVEKELGVELFERSGSSMKLTYAGEQYVKTARTMLLQEENLNHILDGVRQENRGLLRVGISMWRGMQLLPLVLPRFARMFPEVELQLHEHGSGLLEEMTAAGTLDIAFVTTDALNPDLRYRMIENELFGLLVGAGNPLLERFAEGTEMDLKDAEPQTFVSLKHGHNIREIQDEVFRRQGVSPRILTETDSVESALRITMSCGCCMLCATPFVFNNASVDQNSRFYLLKDMQYTRHFYACCRKDKYLPAYAQTFIALTTSAAQGKASDE